MGRKRNEHTCPQYVSPTNHHREASAPAYVPHILHHGRHHVPPSHRQSGSATRRREVGGRGRWVGVALSGTGVRQKVTGPRCIGIRTPSFLFASFARPAHPPSSIRAVLTYDFFSCSAAFVCCTTTRCNCQLRPLIYDSVTIWGEVRGSSDPTPALYQPSAFLHSTGEIMK